MYQNGSKYYTGKPLFHFGAGLSLTTFSLACNTTASQQTTAVPVDGTKSVSVECRVANRGNRTGDEVVQVSRAKRGDSLQDLPAHDRAGVP